MDSSSEDSSSEDSACDFSGVPDNLDNAHNRQWYPRKTLRSIYFPFRALELGLMLAWDSTGKKISRRKMDSLLSMVSDDKFDTRNLIGITAKKLRKLRKTLPLLTTESIECNKTVTKKVYLLMSFRHDKHSLSLQVVDADGLISTKVHEYKTVRVTYVSLTDFIRRVFSDPVQRSSLRFGVEHTGDKLRVFQSDLCRVANDRLPNLINRTFSRTLALFMPSGLPTPRPPLLCGRFYPVCVSHRRFSN